MAQRTGGTEEFNYRACLLAGTAGAQRQT